MNRRAFTLTEMLVTIAVIGILMGLMLAGIQRARAAGRNTQQLNDIRQLHMGWTLYAGQSNESCLPGYMDEAVQRTWKLSYRMRARPEGVASDRLDRRVTQTYPWRLMPFIDHSLEAMFGYRTSEDDGSASFAVEVKPLLLTSGYRLPSELQPLMDNPALLGRTVALQPAFGYNAHYLGGWWDLGRGAEPQPEPAFDAVKPTPQVATALRVDRARNMEVVTRKVGSVRRPEQMVAFVASTFEFGQPNLFDGSRDPKPLAAGAPWCMAPWMGEIRAWTNRPRPPLPDDIPKGGPVPLPRYTGEVATSLVDGSTRTSTFRQLSDMRAWINLPELPNALADDQVHTSDP
ncbi:MAG: type II secretion system protein [Planctomycetes bacterium]|nr:type II secretion system protein [Planctomycetota bacterium]